MARNPMEDRLTAQIALNQSREGRNPERKNKLANAHQKATEILDSNSVKMADFTDLYGKDNVMEDQKTVANRLEEFEKTDTPRMKESKKYADILEAVLFEQIEQSDWLGPDACTIKTSPFDDIVNGVDTVAEFLRAEGATHLALAIDVTYHSHLDRKFERIEGEIRANKLAEIKYFVSENISFRGELKQIPRVIIGVNFNNFEALAAKWLTKDKKFLAQTPIQYLIIEEIRLQLEASRNFAAQLRKGDLVKIYDRSLAILARVIEGKEKETGKSFSNLLEPMKDDKAFVKIREWCENISK